ncbi:hypothetical protein NJ75_01900 [Novosphingobium subterraneum]|uniref:Uncharacterized protein n=1 Tax=Novosphingobium subterraneum TaxID=48936 RepID=A0A0B9A7Q0_9SPHN|nr:hypothetical protein NJ75_01900 [Novosphingobium subterraneum]
MTEIGLGRGQQRVDATDHVEELPGGIRFLRLRIGADGKDRVVKHDGLARRQIGMAGVCIERRRITHLRHFSLDRIFGLRSGRVEVGVQRGEVLKVKDLAELLLAKREIQQGCVELALLRLDGHAGRIGPTIGAKCHDVSRQLADPQRGGRREAVLCAELFEPKGIGCHTQCGMPGRTMPIHRGYRPIGRTNARHGVAPEYRKAQGQAATPVTAKDHPKRVGRELDLYRKSTVLGPGQRSCAIVRNDLFGHDQFRRQKGGAVISCHAARPLLFFRVNVAGAARFPFWAGQVTGTISKNDEPSAKPILR